MDIGTAQRTRFEQIRNQPLSRAAFEARRLAKFHKFTAYIQAHSRFHGDLMAR